MHNRLLIIASVLLASTAIAQRNLIDVPSGEIVESKKLFFQEQTVINKNQFNSSTIFTFGLSKNWELGLSIHQVDFKKSQGVEIDPSTPEENPDLLINAQKGFDVNKKLHFTLGTRSGLSAAKEIKNVKLASFSFATASYRIGDKFQFIAGPYYANQAYAGTGVRAGIMTGVDIQLIKDKVNFVGDLISGNSSLSVINTALEFSLPKQWSITLGAQIPMPASGNNPGAVVQLSKN
jgi:hypothetical protein